MFYGEGLVRGLKDPDPEVRVQAANALRELEDPTATMPLVEALGDPCEDVRRASLRALTEVGDRRAETVFIEALREDDFSLRFWGAIGLKKMGCERAVEALIDALKDRDEGVRAQAVYSLSEIGDRRAIGPLLGVLDDEDLNVRSAALVCLREVFGVEVPSDFEEAWNLMREQTCLNEKMATVLKVISRLEQASGAARDEELYRVLESEHSIGEDEAIGFQIQLMKKGLIHLPRSGYTQICV